MLKLLTLTVIALPALSQPVKRPNTVTPPARAETAIDNQPLAAPPPPTTLRRRNCPERPTAPAPENPPLGAARQEAVAPSAATSPSVAQVARRLPPRPPAQKRGTIEGRVVVMSGGAPRDDASNVVVYLEGLHGSPRSLTGTKPQIRQFDLQFVPALNVVVKGMTVEFPNEDKVFHNIFSVSEPAKFDLGLYKAGEKKAVTFTRAGVVDIYCNIHPQMVAKLKVLDNGYYGMTKRDGSFRIEQVPPGRYPIVAWQASGEEYRGEIIVKPGETARVEMSVNEGTLITRHLRKDGTPYGRYK